MYVAALNNHVLVIVELLRAKAYINQWGHLKNTPLFAAIAGGNTDAIGALLAAKADIHHQNTIGDQPIHAATCYVTSTIEQIILLLEAKADVNATNECGQTPLDAARIRGSQDVVAFLEELQRPTPATARPQFGLVQALTVQNNGTVAEQDLHIAAATG